MTARPRTPLFVLPGALADAGAAVRLGLQLRNVATLTGRCACGAAAEPARRDEHGFLHVTLRHEPNCPAVSREVERYRRGAA